MKRLQWAQLIQDENGQLSRTGLMFMVWTTFMMVCVGYVTFHEGTKLADLPEGYVYLTLVLAGTYTARRFLDNKFGVNQPFPNPNQTTIGPNIITTQPVVAPVIQPQPVYTPQPQPVYVPPPVTILTPTSSIQSDQSGISVTMP